MWPFDEHHRMLGLEDRISRLERDFRALDLDWQATYDKLRSTMGRIVKSRAIIEAKEAAEEEHHPVIVPPAASTHPGLLLSPRQKELQQQILKRRAGG